MLCGGGGWPHQQTDVLKVNLIAARQSVHIDSLWAIYKVQWDQTRKFHHTDTNSSSQVPLHHGVLHWRTWRTNFLKWDEASLAGM
jgi:hypothetical protein